MKRLWEIVKKTKSDARRFILTISIGFEIINEILCSILHMKRYENSVKLMGEIC
ncbi:hypothetical protein U471_12880 [Bacillus amyloliquefaciens CC178]|nr:hypothetical protein U471_12880 [Bacillus amyloliquefaciens CC178]